MDGWKKEIEQEVKAEDRELRELGRQDTQVCWRSVCPGGPVLVYVCTCPPRAVRGRGWAGVVCLVCAGWVVHERAIAESELVATGTTLATPAPSAKGYGH